jgi:hypothetical protein
VPIAMPRQPSRDDREHRRQVFRAGPRGLPDCLFLKRVLHGRLAAADRVIALVLAHGVAIYQPHDGLSISENHKIAFPCRFPAGPPIITARPSQPHDSAWFLFRLTPRKNFYPEFSRAAGKPLCRSITGVGGSQPPQRDSGAHAVPGAATQGEVRLSEN